MALILVLVIAVVRHKTSSLNSRNTFDITLLSIHFTILHHVIGPATIRLQRTELLAGVIDSSYEDYCGDVNGFTHYVSVYSYLRWIENIAGIKHEDAPKCKIS